MPVDVPHDDQTLEAEQDAEDLLEVPPQAVVHSLLRCDDREKHIEECLVIALRDFVHHVRHLAAQHFARHVWVPMAGRSGVREMKLRQRCEHAALVVVAVEACDLHAMRTHEHNLLVHTQVIGTLRGHLRHVANHGFNGIILAQPVP